MIIKKSAFKFNILCNLLEKAKQGGHIFCAHPSSEEFAGKARRY